MNMVSRILLSQLPVLALLSFSPAQAGELTIGAMGAYASSPYKDYDDRFLPIPLVSYEDERFFVRGAGAGVHIWKDATHELSVGLSYLPHEFDNGRTDDRRLKKLDNRHAGLNVDLLYQMKGEWGAASLKVSRDIIGNSDGFSGDLAYRYPLVYGKLSVNPGVGVVWESEKQLDYYYGVSDRESRKSGLKSYDPGNGFSPYLSLNAGYALTENWSLTAGGKITFLSSEIKDSPMVDDSYRVEAFVGVAYSF